MTSGETFWWVVVALLLLLLVPVLWKALMIRERVASRRMEAAQAVAEAYAAANTLPAHPWLDNDPIYQCLCRVRPGTYQTHEDSLLAIVQGCPGVPVKDAVGMCDLLVEPHYAGMASSTAFHGCYDALRRLVDRGDVIIENGLLMPAQALKGGDATE